MTNKRVYGGAFVPLFDDIMSTAEYCKVDPNSCIPFVDYRTRTLSGICRFMRLFDGQSLKSDTSEHDTADTASYRLSLGSNTPIIVRLTGALSVYVFEYFRKQGLNKQAASDKV